MSEAILLPKITYFPVDTGHIQLFARAIGDPNPIYRDPDYAATTPVGGVIAPPTFSEAGNHFDEDWPYRPRWGQPWMGSAASPSGVERPSGENGTAMHAETHFTYHLPVRPGMVLSSVSRPGRQWRKTGPRSGELRFHEVVSNFRDAEGQPVLDCTTVVLRTERTVENEAPSGQLPAAIHDDADVPAFVTEPRRGAGIRVGEKVRDVLVRNLSRAQIVQYAGVSGDFSPQHIDEVFNTRSAGYPSVFAHGMLTMGMLGRAVTDFVGDGTLRNFGFQFRRQVWPGDSIFAELTVAAVGGGETPLVDIELIVTNQHGQLVGKGYAKAAIDR